MSPSAALRRRPRSVFKILPFPTEESSFPIENVDFIQDAVPVAGETLTEALYGKGCSDAVFLCEGPHKLKLTKSNFPDWVLCENTGNPHQNLIFRDVSDRFLVVVGNVGGEKAPGMNDLGDGEYKKFVCVEPTVGTDVAVVRPGGTWCAFHEAERVA